MAIFKVSRPSDCGTYFQSYLQSVMIVANSQEEAQDTLDAWLEEKGECFVKSKYPPQWESWAKDVTCKTPQVIDYTIDSDY